MMDIGEFNKDGQEKSDYVHDKYVYIVNLEDELHQYGIYDSNGRKIY